jgi:signal peptidase
MKTTQTSKLFKNKNNIQMFIVDSDSGSCPPDDREGVYFCAHIGTSMNPTLNRLDLLKIAPYSNHNEPKTGDVILFKHPSGDLYVIHRIIHTQINGYMTRGDNCSEKDDWFLKDENILGKVIAALRNNSQRKIANGFLGRIVSKYCQLRRFSLILIFQFFKPAYKSLCTGGILHWLIPVRLTPQVATFQSGTNDVHKLLLGKRIIGSYNETLLQWQIRRPYRLFVDESSLPKPR